MAIGASSVAATRAAPSPLNNMATLPVSLARGDHRRARGARLGASGAARRPSIHRVRRKIAWGLCLSSPHSPKPGKPFDEGDCPLLSLPAFQPGHQVEPKQRTLAVPGLATRALPE